MNYHNVEWFANKGFQVLRLRKRSNQAPVIIANTHMQSNTEISWWFGSNVIKEIRYAQTQQILDFFDGVSTPVLVIGDLNCETPPHPHLRFLHPLGQHMRKATFYSTGEDLDHIGWLPLQFAPPGCSFCDVERRGPILTGCKVYQLPFSDHAPVHTKIYIPIKKEQ